MSTRTTAAERSPMEWDIDIPLVTNRHIISGLATAIFGGASVITVLVGIPLGMQGEWAVVPKIALLLFSISGALLALGLAVAMFVFGNTLHARFSIDADGVRFRTNDRASAVAARGNLWLGLALGSGAAVGSGLIAATAAEQSLHWRGAFRALCEPSSCSIGFRNGWRTLLRLYCRPSDYPWVERYVREQMAQHGTAERAAGSSPVGAWLLRTLIVLIATLPVFAVHETFGYGLLAPMLLLCFGIATVWFVRPMAWVVLLVIAGLVLMAIVGATDVRSSQFGAGSYRRFEVMSGDDWALTALAVVGISSLLWLAVATLARKIVPALTADLTDASDEYGG